MKDLLWKAMLAAVLVLAVLASIEAVSGPGWAVGLRNFYCPASASNCNTFGTMYNGCALGNQACDLSTSPDSVIFCVAATGDNCNQLTTMNTCTLGRCMADPTMPCTVTWYKCTN